MWLKRAALSFVISLLTVTPVAAQSWAKVDWDKLELVTCPFGKLPITRPLAGYKLTVASERNNQNGHPCRAVLRRPGGKSTKLLEEWDISIYSGTGEDINDDGSPDLVLEGYTGGAHCCYRYVVVSLTKEPRIVAEFDNNEPLLFFRDARDAKFKIRGADGAFDYLDELCFACSPFPWVVLELEGTKLVNAGASFLPEYDKEIAEARKKWELSDGEAFRACEAPATGDAKAKFQDARQLVLTIVLSYLNSGREAQAWRALDQMWPPSDEKRIKRLILKARADSLLLHLND
jgi:hypothetical protein